MQEKNQFFGFLSTFFLSLICKVVTKNNKQFVNMICPYLCPLSQVHNRAEYLQFLIESITNQRSRQHLNETLVVFSHDVYDEEVFNKIEEITTFKVIFY